MDLEQTRECRAGIIEERVETLGILGDGLSSEALRVWRVWDLLKQEKLMVTLLMGKGKADSTFIKVQILGRRNYSGKWEGFYSDG